MVAWLDWVVRGWALASGRKRLLYVTTSEENVAMKTKHDWRRADARTDAQVHRAALADPDAQPLTPERLAGTLRDWERGSKEPDQAAQSYLRAIPGDPEAVS